MTTTKGALPPTTDTPAVFVLGAVTGGVIGGSLAGFIVGCLIQSVLLCVMSVGLPALYGLLVFLAGVPRRARRAAVAPRTALALVESSEAVGGEATSDVAVRFDLTVAPDDTPAYRVEFTQSINLVALSDYRAGSIAVVQYPPDRLWQVRIVKRPTPAWEERAAGACLDSAPGPAMVSEPSEGSAVGFVRLFALLLAAAGVVLLFRADLFDSDTSTKPSASVRPSGSSTSSTRVVSSDSGTVTLGPGQSFLDKGELRRAVDLLTKDTGQALTVVVQERLLSVVFAPTGSQAPRFDPSSVPYERFPALVEEAGSTLVGRSPQTWQITVDRLSGSLTIRVGVTGTHGSASLEADGRGEAVRSTLGR